MPATEPGVLALSGPVTFDHTASLAARLRGQAGQAQALDWSGVTQVDSSAVALMLELARAAGHRHQQQVQQQPWKLRTRRTSLRMPSRGHSIPLRSGYQRLRGCLL